jgi:ATP-binding cassette subfamily B protein
VLLEEKKLTDSLRDLNTQQQLILGTGGIVMSYLWYIQPDLGVSDFVMMNLLIQQLFQPLNQVGMIYREWKQSVHELGPLTLPPR